MGNYFYRARYYNQSLGRFFSRDPIMSLQSLYAYCHNSPTNFTDPLGMMDCKSKKTKEECLDCYAFNEASDYTKAYFKKEGLYGLAAAWDTMALYVAGTIGYAASLLGACVADGEFFMGFGGGAFGSVLAEIVGYQRKARHIREQANRMYKADIERAKSDYEACKDTCKNKKSAKNGGGTSPIFVTFEAGYV